MAAVRTFGSVASKLLFKGDPYFCITRNYSPVKDHMIPLALKKHLPSKFPETEEERRKAAERYRLHPDEYKPITDFDHGYGDYPDLPRISADARDPYYPWDYPEFKHNYGETLHHDFDIMGHDRISYGVREDENLHIDAIKCVLFFSAIGLVWYLFPDTNPPVLEKQYPGKGKHYLFEPAR